jgi:hypothetical protein
LSTGFQDKKRPRARYWFDSRRYYFQKTHGDPYLWAANAVWMTSYAAWRVRKAVTRLPDQDPPNLLRDFVRWTVLKPRKLEKGPVGP